MLGFDMTQDFRVDLSRLRRPRTLNFSSPIQAIGKFKSLAFGAAAGWCGVILVGGVMMTRAAHVAPSDTAAPLAPAVAAAPAPKVAQAPVVKKPDPIAAVVSTPAPAAAPTPVAKSTQRVDMTPTASIPLDPPAKPKHKHKKKPKALDAAN